jgi:hypothetical protein
MILYSNKFDSFSSVNYVLNDIAKAIGTTYIPTGDNVQEIINSFTKIQLSRTFNPEGCYGQATLSLYFNEDGLCVYYSSTSGTSVQVMYNFDTSMEVKSIDLSVTLPDDRALPGRCHYETLTHTLYSNDWLNINYDNERVDIVIPWELQRLNKEIDFSNLIPNWVEEEHSNYTAHFNPDLVNAELQEIGYEQCSIPGFIKSWYNSTLNQYVVFHSILHSVDNNYYILKEGKNWDFSYGMSYERIKTLLYREYDKLINEVIEEIIIEEYEYDENEEYANDDED